MPLYFNNGSLLRGVGNTLASSQGCCCTGDEPPMPCLCGVYLARMKVVFERKTFILGQWESFMELSDTYVEEWFSSVASNAFVFIYYRTLNFPPGALADYKIVRIKCAEPGDGSDFWVAEYETVCYEYSDVGNETAQTIMFSIGDFLCYRANIYCGDGRPVGAPIPLGEPVFVDDYETITPPGLASCTPVRATVSIEEACIT